MVVEGQTFVSGAGSETLFCAWTLLVLPWILWVRRPFALGLIFLLGLTGTVLLGEALCSVQPQGSALLPAAVWSFIWLGILRVALPDETPMASGLRLFVRLVTVILTAGLGSFNLFVDRAYDWTSWVLLAGFLPLAYGRTLPTKIIALLGWLAIINQSCNVWITSSQWLWPTIFGLNLLGLGALYALIRRSGHGTHGWLITAVKVFVVVPLLISLVSLINLLFNEQISGIVLYGLAIVAGMTSLTRREALHPFVRLVALLIGFVGVFFIDTALLSEGYKEEALTGLYPFLAEVITVLCLILALLYRSSFALFVTLMVALGLKAADVSMAILWLLPLTVASLLAVSHDDERIANVGHGCLMPLLWALFVIHTELFSVINPTILTAPVQTGLMVGLTLLLFMLPDADGRSLLRRGLMGVAFASLVYFWPQAIAPVLGAVAIMRASKSLRPCLLFSVLAMALILYVLRASGAIDQGDLLLRAAWETLGIGVVFLVTALIAKSASFKALPTLETHTPVKRACPIGALLWLLIVMNIFGVTHWRDQALLSSGDVMVARLAPVDPRDVLMGDYMALSYKVDIDTMSQDPNDTHTLGLTTRSDGQYELVASQIGQPVTLSSDSFDPRIVKLPRRWFFASGEAKRWENATHAVLRRQFDESDDTPNHKIVSKCLLETLQ